MAVVPVSHAEPPPPSSDATALHRVVRGDTLWGIADALRRAGDRRSTGELLSAILRLNPQLRDPDRIEVGEELRLPAPLGRGAGAAARRAPAVMGRASPDGTPCFRQADGAWRDVRLADGGPTLARAGCAVTSCAMALSKLTGTWVTPRELVERLRSARGLDGAGRIVWARAAEELRLGLGNPRQPWAVERLRRELEAGRPVVVGVHKQGKEAGAEPSHWVCVTRYDRSTGAFWANDPATGQPTELRLDRATGALVSAAGSPVAYVSAGRMVTFAA